MGSEAFNLLKQIHPGLKVLLSSGYSLSEEATEIIKRGCQGFIQKPFSVNQFSIKIREALDGNGNISQMNTLGEPSCANRPSI